MPTFTFVIGLILILAGAAFINLGLLAIVVGAVLIRLATILGGTET